MMPRQLTTQMKSLLLDTVRGEKISANANTSAGLVKRGFLDLTGALTNDGWKLAVAMLPLTEQCHHLGITYEKLHGLDFKKNPEIAAWRHYSSIGYVGGYCEGGPILLLIRSATLNVLAKLNTLGSRQDACTRFTEAQLFILRDHSDLILSEVRSITREALVQNFTEIYNSPMIQEWYPGLTQGAVASIFDTLTSERLAEITSVIMEDPYKYRAGWPDLTMTNGTELLWAEIKTTDRLHMSQITTLHRMMPLLPGKIRVILLTE